MKELIEVLEPEILSPLEELSTSALIVKAEARLTINSFDSKFVAKAEAALASLENKLETDEDFDKAKKDVKACETTEKNLKAALDDNTSGNKEIAEVKDRIEGYIAAFSSKRLDLNKSVTKRDKEKKEAIVAAGNKRIADALAISPVKNRFNPDYGAIAASIKGKKKYVFMEKAVDEIVTEEIQRLAGFEAVYLANTTAIDKARIDYPVLFHDREALALQDVNIVTLTIESRIAAHKLAEKERIDREEKKAEADRKEKAEREETARKAREESERKVIAEAAVVRETPVETRTEGFSAPSFTIDGDASNQTFSDPPIFMPPCFDPPPAFEAQIFTVADPPQPEIVRFMVAITSRSSDIDLILEEIRSIPLVVIASHGGIS